MNRTSGQLLCLCMVVGLVSSLIYLPVLGFDFVNWDDDGYVSQNAALTALNLDFVSWAFHSTEMGNWHPLTWISYSLDRFLWGSEASGFHLTNVILHALNTMLVTWLTGWLAIRYAAQQGNGYGLFLAASVGLIFGLHPLHVESVAWISERKDVLYALFWLLAMLFYVQFQRVQTRGMKTVCYLLSLCAFALSLMSKAMAVTLPLVLLLLDYYPLKRQEGRSWRFAGKLLMEKMPYFVLSLAVAILTLMAQRETGAMEAMLDLSLAERLLNAANAVVFYLHKFLVPNNLLPFYSLDRAEEFLLMRGFLSVILLVLLTVVALLLRKRQPVLLLGWAFFLLTLLPVSGLVQVGGAMAADRYMYLPMVGPTLILAALLVQLALNGQSVVRWSVAALASGVLVSMLILTSLQLSIWKNSVTLWEYLILGDPASTLAHFNLGDYYRAQGELTQAALHWHKVIELEPAHSEALNQLGSIYLLNNQNREALSMYERSVDANENNAEARYNLAMVYERLNNHQAALSHYRVFLERAPERYAYLEPSVRRKVAELSRIR